MLYHVGRWYQHDEWLPQNAKRIPHPRLQICQNLSMIYHVGRWYMDAWCPKMPNVYLALDHLMLYHVCRWYKDDWIPKNARRIPHPRLQTFHNLMLYHVGRCYKDDWLSQNTKRTPLPRLPRFQTFQKLMSFIFDSLKSLSVVEVERQTMMSDALLRG